MFLGIRYLWIDSLCRGIVQRSKTDWEYEAARIGAYASDSPTGMISVWTNTLQSCSLVPTQMGPG